MDAQGFPRQLARTRRFSLGVPQHLTVSPDGARVLFVRTTSGTDAVSRLWLYEQGAERMLADPASLGGEGDGRAAGGRPPRSGSPSRGSPYS